MTVFSFLLCEKTIGDIFSEFRTSFGCREINFATIDGECEQNTHSHQHVQMRTVCQHITLHSLINCFITRPRVAQDCTLLCPKNIPSSSLHVSFLAASDPDQHKFSHSPLPILQSFSPSTSMLTRSKKCTATIHGGVADPRNSHLPQFPHVHGLCLLPVVRSSVLVCLHADHQGDVVVGFTLGVSPIQEK